MGKVKGMSIGSFKTLNRSKVIQRTSFRLSSKAHRAIKAVAKLEKFSIAHAIDEIVDIGETLTKMGESFRVTNEFTVGKGVRKTYAVFEDTLKRIERQAKSENVSRDLLLEFLVLSIGPRLTHEDSLRARKYMQIYEKHIMPLWREMEAIRKNLARQLSVNDPLLERYQAQIKRFGRLIDFIKESLPEDME